MEFQVINQINGQDVPAYEGDDSREASWYYVLSRKAENVVSTKLLIDGKETDPLILDEMNGSQE